MIDTSLFSDRPGGLFIVAGEHDHLNAHVLQLANRIAQATTIPEEVQQQAEKLAEAGKTPLVFARG